LLELVAAVYGSAVTAASYQRAWERNLSPKMGSPVGVNDQFQNVVVGAKAFNDGKAKKRGKGAKKGKGRKRR